jgi:hypothetical protein
MDLAGAHQLISALLISTFMSGPAASKDGAYSRSDDETRIALSAVNQLIQSNVQAICLANPIQGYASDYLDQLKSRAVMSGIAKEREAYLKGASKLPKSSLRRLDSRALSMPELRSAYPHAKRVGPSECGRLITVFRPIILGQAAFLIASIAGPCGATTYRMALKRGRQSWSVGASDAIYASQGPPGCGSLPWDSPSGLRIDRIRITD